MRISTFLLFIFICGMNAKINSQNSLFTIDKNNVELENILNEVENQSDYLFIYNKNVNVNRKTSVNISGLPLPDALDKIFNNMDIGYEIDGSYILLSVKDKKELQVAEQPKRVLKGTVTDMRGEPLIGVSVFIKGTTIGTATDIDGEYTLTLPDNSKDVVFSYIGFTPQEIAIGKKTAIDVTLIEDNQQLNEVLVVGYGTQKKGLVTGSISLTKGEDLIKSPSQNVGQSLQGRISGVVMNVRTGEPGKDGASISIRGKSTTGNTDPLILVDGIANRSGNWDRINPNDIESITVLKDASASIYGSRSANGVILITTKRGKEGKPTIDYSYNVGIQQPTRIAKLADAGTFAQVLNEIEEYEGRAPRYTPDEVEKFRNGSDPLHYPNTDWVKETLKNASLQQKHNLSLRGGNERVKYFVGAGFADQDAIYKKSDTYFRQYNIRSNIDAKITNYLTLSVDLAGRIEDQHYSGYDGGNIFYTLVRSFPTSLARYPNGLPTAGMDIGNPVTLATNETGYMDYKKSVFNSTFSVNLDLSWLTEGLSVDAYAAFDKEGMEKKEWKTPFYYYVWDEDTDIYEKKKNGSRDYASLRQDYVPRTSLTLNARINYKKTFNRLHGLEAMVGYEQNEHKGNDFWTSRSNYLSIAIDQMFAGSSNKDHFDNGGSAFEQARQSYFGRVGYDYAGKYMAQFNFRYDGSYIFQAGERWGFFPGVSVGWRLSEESFIKDNLFWMDNLKVKASYGQQGNDNVGAFQYLLKYATGRNYVFGNTDVQGVYQEGFPNKHITWEVADTYNVGIEGDFWNGLLGFEIEAFKTKRSNILRKRSASIPQYTGLKDLPDENIGKVQNKGVEVQLNHRKRIDKVNFSASGNFLFARNKVLYMDETPWGEGYDYMKQEGQPLDAGLYYEVIGIFKDWDHVNSYPHLEGARPGDLIYRDVDGNGEINSMDRVRQSLSTFPEIVFGLTLNAQWNNFDVSVLLQGQARAKLAVYSQVGPTGNFHMASVEDRWTEDNPNGTNPRAGGFNNAQENYGSDFYLKDATFLRLKNMEIGYTLPKTLFSKVGVTNCRFYVSGYNLLTLDKVKVVDPETQEGKGTYYPQMRIFNMGVNVTF